MIWSLRNGKPAGHNPWGDHRWNGRRRTCRRTTATGARSCPVVYRWAYDYSVPGAEMDFIPQNRPVDAQHATGTAEHGRRRPA